MSSKSFKMPPSIEALGPDVVAQVQRLLESAEARQRQEGIEATDKALKIVPRPLRPVARRVLGA